MRTKNDGIWGEKIGMRKPWRSRFDSRKFKTLRLLCGGIKQLKSGEKWGKNAKISEIFSKNPKFSHFWDKKWGKMVEKCKNFRNFFKKSKFFTFFGQKMGLKWVGNDYMVINIYGISKNPKKREKNNDALKFRCGISREPYKS